jgi:two-component system NtrC family response regulator
LPPLRERGKDVLLLAAHFIRKHDASGKIRRIHSAAERAMQIYQWPGNVRELENMVRRAIILSNGPIIKLDAVDLDAPADAPGIDDAQIPLSLQEARSAVEKKLLLESLKRYSGNIMQASQAIGVSRPTFYDLLKKHKIEL